jgi:hypothetical protein
VSKFPGLRIAIAGAVASLALCGSTPAEAIAVGSPSAGLSGRHCLVPRLVGKKLRTAKRELRTADCRIGAVKKSLEPRRPAAG